MADSNEGENESVFTYKNRLKFSSDVVFSGTLMDLKFADPTDLQNFEDGLEFKSLRQSQSNLDFQNYQSKLTSVLSSADTLEILVQDDVFASVLNDSGFVQIEDWVFRISATHVFFATEDFEEELHDDDHLLSLVSQNKGRLSPQTQASGVNSFQIIEEGDGGSAGGTPESYLERKVEKYYSGGARRMKGLSWNRNWYVYSSVGAKTENQKHNWGLVWANAESDKVGLSFDLVYTPLKAPGEVSTPPDKFVPYYHTKSNAKRINVTVDNNTMLFSLTISGDGSSEINLPKPAKEYKVKSMQSKHWIQNPNYIEGFTQL